METEKQMMNRGEAAEYIGVTSQTLRTWELDGRGPKFSRLNYNTIRYRRSNIDAWLDSQAETPGEDDAT